MPVDLARARERIPAMLEELRDVDPEGAAWIEDVYSEVLRELRFDNVTDPWWVETLGEALRHHLDRA